MINSLFFNFFLAILFVALNGSNSVITFIGGFIIGAFTIYAFEVAMGRNNYLPRFYKLIRFGLYFMKILIQANWQIAMEILSSGNNQKPRIIRYPLKEMTDVEITTLANSITLTPGTLVIDVSDCKRYMYIHCIFAENEQEAIAELDELARHLHEEVFA